MNLNKHVTINSDILVKQLQIVNLQCMIIW